MDIIYIVCFVLTALLITITVMYFLKKTTTTSPCSKGNVCKPSNHVAPCTTGNVCKPSNYVEPCTAGNVCKSLTDVTPFFVGPSIAKFASSHSLKNGFLSSDGLTIIWENGGMAKDGSVIKRVTPVIDNNKTQLDTGKYMDSNNTIVTLNTKPQPGSGWVFTQVNTPL